MAAASRVTRNRGGTYVVVFRTDKPDVRTCVPQTGELQNTRTRAEWVEWIVAMLKEAGLRVSKHEHSDGQKYALVGAAPSRLAKEAQRIKLRVKTGKGGTGDPDVADEFRRSYPWAGQYEPFEVKNVQKYASFYAMQRGHSESWPGPEANESAAQAVFDFGSKDRAQLIHSIMETEHHMGGAGLDFDLFKHHGVVEQVFPLHGSGRHPLRKSWGNMRLICTNPCGLQRRSRRRTCGCGCGPSAWNQPLDDVRDYFGEKIAFYHAFLGHYTKYVALLAAVATPVYGAMVWSWEEPDHPWHTEFLPAAYGLFLLVWSSVMLQAWKQLDSALAIRWGIDKERCVGNHVRVQYYGTPRDSRVRVDLHGNAAEEVWYPTWKRVVKYTLTSTITVVSLAVVASSLAALILFRAWFERPPRGANTLGVALGGCISGPVVLLANWLNKWVALKLTEFENHRTQGQYERSLVVKRFFFQFCNSYITLYYIAFFKPFAREQSWTFLGNDFECVNDNCFEEVSTHLLAMFCTQLVIQNIINVAAPLCTRRRRPRATTVRTDTGFNEQLIQQDDHSDPDTLPRYIEEAQSPAQPSIFDAYDEFVIQYGYITLFAMACPLVSLLAAVHNLAAIRSKSCLLCQMYQRPTFEECGGGMGSWSTALLLMVNASVVTNCALVFFSMKSTQEWFPDQLTRVLLFFAAEHVILVLGSTLDSLVPATAQRILDEQAREQHQKTIRDQLQPEQLGVHTFDPGRVHPCRERWQSTSDAARRQTEC